MADKKEKKPSSIDDLLEGMAKDHSKNLDEAFAAHDKWTKDEHQNHLYNNIFSPGIDGLYSTITSELDKMFSKDDEAKVYQKEKEIKKAVVAGLKKYFEKVQPSVTKAIENSGMDEAEQYEYLSSMYDDHVGVGTNIGQQLKIPSIKSLTDHARNKKSTVGHLKRQLSGEVRDKYITGAMMKLGTKHTSHHFARYDPHVIAAYLKPKLEKAGYEIEDALGFYQADLGELIGLRKSVVEGKGHDYIKKKESGKGGGHH